MKKRSFLKMIGLFFLFGMSISVGCNNDKDDGKNSVAEPAVTEATTATPVTPAVTTFSGLLDTLWVDSLSFTKLDNKKTVFVFIFTAADTETLHGWKAKGILGDEYETDPDIRLEKGGASTETYGAGTYFGNVILYKKDVKEIIKLLKDNKAQYVLFAPHKENEHITYTVWLSKEHPLSKIKILAAIPTNVETNPSPPKNY